MLVVIGRMLPTNCRLVDLLDSLYENVKKWLHHAKYWLTEYKNPVHILIYNNVVQNTAKEIEETQKFLGYKFNGVNLR